jgi:hypothetical protein
MLNGVVIVWVVLLLFGPGLLLAPPEKIDAAWLAGTSCLTLVALCFVEFVVARSGHGTIGAMRVCVALLSLVLLGGLVRLALRLRGSRGGKPFGYDALALPVGLLAAIWVMVPPLLELGRLGVRFGLATAGNSDLPNYALIATNVASSGFLDSHHVAGFDFGTFSREDNYMGATTLINFVSAATGLAAWQACMAVMGVALSLSAVALWALTKSVWPTARYAAPAAVLVASFASLSVFLVGQYFLGGVLGMTSVALALAGATMLAQPAVNAKSGMLALVAGDALGVYSYGHLGLPVLFLLPFWTILSAVLSGARSRNLLIKIAARSVGGSAVALVLSAIAVRTAANLVRSQSQAVAGFTEPPMSATGALLWPPGIGAHSSAEMISLSWLIVAAIVVAGYVAAWRYGLRGSAAIGATLTLGCVLVTIGCVIVYGPPRYQTWKMESFLLPLALAVSVPAVASLRFRRAEVGRALVTVVVGVVTLGPALAWQPSISRAQDVATTAGAPGFTSRSLVDLANSRQLAKLSSVNVRLGPFFETMAAGNVIPTPVVIFSSRTYLAPATLLKTCTLTRRDMLSPGDTAFTDLGGGYVLLQRPSKCALRKK